MDHCPPFQAFFSPMLHLAHEGEINVRQSAETIADILGLSAIAKLEKTNGGARKRYLDRTMWAATYLRQAGLINTSRRGFVIISPERKAFLEKHPANISITDLQEIEAFVHFQNRRRPNAAPSALGL